MYKLFLDRASKILLLIIVSELCLGGGGRLIPTGSLSLRMILFGIAMLLSGLMLLSGKTIPRHYQKILIAFALVILVSVVCGLLNHNPINLLFEDVKPLLYFLILMFFALTIDWNEILSISKIIKISSIIIAVAFFLVLFLIHGRIIPFNSFYLATEPSTEFFYRGQLTFFFKGFLFLGIGAIFFYFSDLKIKYLLITFLVSAIVVSVTRGLLFSLAVTFAIYFLEQRRNIYKAFIFIALAFIVVVWGNKITTGLSRLVDSGKSGKSYKTANTHLFGDRNYSDVGRSEQIREVAERFSLQSALLGHGFGRGVPSRPVHMEIAYLEVFHKQGIIGLVFWGIVAMMIFNAYLKSDKSLLAQAFFYSSIFVFTESGTNQYFNNPIGMSVLLLSLVCMDKLKNQSR